MRHPGFTAEAALGRSSAHYRTTVSWLGPLAVVPTIAASAAPRREDCLPCVCVTPEGCPCCDVMTKEQPAFMSEGSTTLNCEPGSEGVCQEWCDHAGGGMQSNPDGSTTCTVYS